MKNYTDERTIGRPIKIRIAFDETASAESAEILVRHAAGDFVCETQLLPFKELEPPGPCVAAARNASDTDIMILAIREDRALPDYVQLWIGLWLGLREADQGGALVVLITKANAWANPDSSLLDYFEAVAAIGGLELFAQPRSVEQPRMPERYISTRLRAVNPCPNHRPNLPAFRVRKHA